MKESVNYGFALPEDSDAANVGPLKENWERADAILRGVEMIAENLDANAMKKNNTEEYIPTEPYHPATKKFVEDTVS